MTARRTSVLFALGCASVALSALPARAAGSGLGGQAGSAHLIGVGMPLSQGYTHGNTNRATPGGGNGGAVSLGGLGTGSHASHGAKGGGRALLGGLNSARIVGGGGGGSGHLGGVGAGGRELGGKGG
jgi:hypothetical protein